MYVLSYIQVRDIRDVNVKFYLSDIYMKTRSISLMVLCITLIADCFIINKGILDAAYAQNNTNIFGIDGNKQSSGHEGLPFLGVNMRGYNTSLPQAREI